MSAVAGDGEFFPFRNIDVRHILDASQRTFSSELRMAAYLEKLRVSSISNDQGDFTHCLDAEDALERKIGLKSQPAVKIVCRDY